MEAFQDFTDLANLLAAPHSKQLASGAALPDLPPAPAQNSPADLDPFLLEGDDQTWIVDDWNWDPYNLSAVPKEAPAVQCCQALKRLKADASAERGVNNQSSAGVFAATAACGGRVSGDMPHHQSLCCSTPNIMNAGAVTAPAAALLQMMNPADEVGGGSAMHMVMTPEPNPSLYQPMQWAPSTWLPASSTPLSEYCAAPDIGMAAPMATYSGGVTCWNAMPPAATAPTPLNTSSTICADTINNANVYCQQAMAPPQAACCSARPIAASASHVSAPASSCQGHVSRPAPVKPHMPIKPAGRTHAPLARKHHRSESSDVDTELSDDEARAAAASVNARGSVSPPPGAATYTGDINQVAVLGHSEDGMTGVCQVAGCGKDLTGLKDYHQRYHICEVHIRLPQVLREGQLQRFCQQCGRFHELCAFDGVRKSCREQLSKHNARRRRRAQAEQAKGRAAEALANIAPEENTACTSRLVQSLLHDPQQLQALRMALGFPTHPALPMLTPYQPGQGSTCTPVQEPATYNLARNVLDGVGEFNPSYASEHVSLRISMKLFNKTPVDLPTDLREQLAGWLDSAPAAVVGHIRPGCVFLTMQLLLSTSAYQKAEASGLEGLLDYLLNHSGCAFWHRGIFIAQMLDRMSQVSEGVVCSAVDLSKTPPASYPTLSCVKAGSGSVLRANKASIVRIAGHHLDEPGVELICRYRGKTLRPALQLQGNARASFHLPPMSGCDIVWLELVRAGYMTHARPLLVVDDDTIYNEVSRLLSSKVHLRRSQVEGLLVDLALLLQQQPVELPDGSNDHAAGPGQQHSLTSMQITLKARRMLSFACDMGWAAVAARMLPLATTGCQNAEEAVMAVQTASPELLHPVCGMHTLSMLHRAVRGGSLELLAGILTWGRQHGYCWRPDLAGPGGLTPLHLAALLEEPLVALMLLDHMGGNNGGATLQATVFTRLATPDGVTPFHLAFQMGHWSVDALLARLLPPVAACGAKHQHHDAFKCDSPGKSEEIVDPCAICKSTMAPLVLSVSAACADCGERQSCLEEDGRSRCMHSGARARETPASSVLSAAAAALVPQMANQQNLRTHGSSKRQRGCTDVAPGIALAAGMWQQATAAVVPASCKHRHGACYSIMAMCQSCHANRVMTVA